MPVKPLSKPYLPIDILLRNKVEDYEYRAIILYINGYTVDSIARIMRRPDIGDVLKTVLSRLKADSRFIELLVNACQHREVKEKVYRVPPCFYAIHDLVS